MQVTLRKKYRLTPATVVRRLDRRDPSGPQQTPQARAPDNLRYRLFVDQLCWHKGKLETLSNFKLGT
jgi:hypothetical protein